MSEPGYDEFAGLWNEPDFAEQDALKAMARRARRRGKLLAYADLAWWIVLVGGLVFAFFLRPSWLLIGVGILLIAATSYITVKRRQLIHLTRTLNTANRHDFLESCIRIAEGNIRRCNLNLTLLPLAPLLGVTAKAAIRSGGHIRDPLGATYHWLMSLRGVLTLLFFLGFVAFTLRVRARHKSELRRLEALRADYEEEEQWESEA